MFQKMEQLRFMSCTACAIQQLGAIHVHRLRMAASTYHCCPSLQRASSHQRPVPSHLANQWQPLLQSNTTGYFRTLRPCNTAPADGSSLHQLPPPPGPSDTHPHIPITTFGTAIIIDERHPLRAAAQVLHSARVTRFSTQQQSIHKSGHFWQAGHPAGHASSSIMNTAGDHLQLPQQWAPPLG
jgi:hypothetical protein